MTIDNGETVAHDRTILSRRQKYSIRKNQKYKRKAPSLVIHVTCADECHLVSHEDGIILTSSFF